MSSYFDFKHYVPVCVLAVCVRVKVCPVTFLCLQHDIKTQLMISTIIFDIFGEHRLSSESVARTLSNSDRNLGTKIVATTLKTTISNNVCLHDELSADASDFPDELMT